jgi:hypothetical protein
MADETFAENPWSAEFWSLTRQGEYVKKYGTEVAKTKAKKVGAKLGDLKPRELFVQQPLTVLVQRRNIGGGSGGSIVGAGSSGDGPPV